MKCRRLLTYAVVTLLVIGSLKFAQPDGHAVAQATPVPSSDDSAEIVEDQENPSSEDGIQVDQSPDSGDGFGSLDESEVGTDDLNSQTPSLTPEITPTQATDLDPTATSTPPEEPIVPPTIDCGEELDVDIQVGGRFKVRCVVIVSDPRTSALVAIDPEPDWLVSLENQDESNSQPQFVVPIDAAADPYVLQFDLIAPPRPGSTGGLEIRLYQDSVLGNVVDSILLNATTFVPEGWNLDCGVTGENPMAGMEVAIQCQLPEDAWALRDQAPSASYSSGGEPKFASINSSIFDIFAPVACGVENLNLEISADLGHGLMFDTRVHSDIVQPPQPKPVLTYSDIEFGSTTWAGTYYPPVESEVILTVRGATGLCQSGAWLISAEISPFTQGNFEFEIPIAYEILAISDDSVSSGTILPETPTSLIAGSGNVDITLRLTLTIPSTAISGQYEGNVVFSLSRAP